MRKEELGMGDGKGDIKNNINRSTNCSTNENNVMSSVTHLSAISLALTA